MKRSPKTEQEEIDPQAVNLLAKIAPIPRRSDNAARAGRAVFLEQARLVKLSFSPLPNPKPARPSFLSRKWLFGLNPLLTMLVIVSVILGSTTTTVYAAQYTTPDHFLYPVKIASEDIRLSLASNPGDKVGMDIEFANRRLQEANTLTDQEKSVPGSVPSSWGRHLDDVFEHSQQMSDAQMSQILLELRSSLTRQLQTTSQLATSHPNDSGLSRLQREIHASLNLVEFGLSHPLAFRQQIKVAGGREIENEMESMEGEQEEENTSQVNPTPTLTTVTTATKKPAATPFATLENRKKTAVPPTLESENNEENQTPEGNQTGATKTGSEIQSGHTPEAVSTEKPEKEPQSAPVEKPEN